MSMTRDALKEMLKIFPEKFFLFGVYTPAPTRALIASSICIEVQKNILYIFYWGEDPAYRKLSPVTLLSKIIYGYAQDYKFDLLDAGIASSEGKINLGLIKFKQNLGFRASSKIILTKSFPQLNDGN
jgi:lipid II:glycine glycyltransferase (peptidoglycan interpeptide bridge formation enzyme)